MRERSLCLCTILYHSLLEPFYLGKRLHSEEAQRMLPVHQMHQHLYTLSCIDSARV